MKLGNPRLAFALGATLVAACGSSNDMMNNTGSTGSIGSTGGLVSGTVVKGPVSGATVTAFAITGGTMGAQVGGGTTDAMGNFNIAVGSYGGPMMLQASGGTYTDEATGTTMTMQSGDVMAAAIPNVPAGGTMSGIQVTPLTSMAHERAHHMTGGITAANISAANAWIGTYFGVSDILQVVPMNPLVAGAGTGASQDSKNYGMSLAAMSQYAKSIGMTSSSGMITAMMDDASDGVLDGRMGSTAVQMGGGMPAGTTMQAGAGTTGLASAMATFIGSSMNKSGVVVSDLQTLMTKMSGSTGGSMGSGGMTGGTMSGTGTKGPVAGATVTAYSVQNGMVGAQLGNAQTDANGGFTMQIGAYAGPVMIQMAGGSFVDEATGSTMPMMSGDVMSACIPSMTAGATITGLQVTPLTTMACARSKNMSGAMTAANMTTTNTAVGSYFSVGDILTTMPMNPTVTGSGATASQDSKNYGMVMAAMSQYAAGIGMTTSSSGMITAMMDDASDGVMDGMMGSSPVSMAGMGGMMSGSMQPSAARSAMATAMAAFIGSGMNRSGVSLADMQALMNQLSGSNGQLPGAGGSTGTGMMNGSAYMGAMSAGTVTAFSISNGTMGPQIATARLDSSGSFSMSLGAYAGPVLLQVSNGTFRDPATGTNMTMQPGDVITSAVPSFAEGTSMTSVHVTPLTSMAQARAQMMSGGMTAANIAAANASVGSYFMVSDLLMDPPLDPAQPGARSGATQTQMDAGMTIAAMSKYAQSIGMTSSSGMVTAMMKDASDGVLNGMMGSTSITMTGMSGGGMGGSGGMSGGTMMQGTAGTSGMANAMSAFVGSGMNVSGVTISDMQALMTKLGVSSGMLP